MFNGERDLINACQAGLEKAYLELIRLYEKKVFNTALRLVGIEYATDITQEVFLRIFTNIRKFRQEASLNTWIYRITVNTSRDLLRKRKREGEQIPFNDELQMVSCENGPETKIEKKFLQEEIEKAIMMVPRTFREVLVLRELEELSYDKIAVILKIPVGTVKSRLARARLLFKKACLERSIGCDEVPKSS